MLWFNSLVRAILNATGGLVKPTRILHPTRDARAGTPLPQVVLTQVRRLARNQIRGVVMMTALV
jgi:hypothetical protein